MAGTDWIAALDAVAAAAAPWIATWLAHSTVLLGAALLLRPRLRSGAAREQLLKVASIGALLTVGAQALGAPSLLGPRLELPVASGRGAAIAVVLPQAPPQLAAPTALARGADVPAQAPAEAAPATTQRWARLLALAFVSLALFGAGRLVRDRQRLTRQLRHRRRIGRGPWGAELERLCARAGRRRTPTLSAARSLTTPIALRDEIVVPERALRALDDAERRSLLAHELAHVVRRDAVWIALVAGLERVLALQPLHRLVGRRLRAEFELRCDQAAVRWCGDGLGLARCLAKVAAWMRPGAASSLAATMAAERSALVQRVEQILSPTPAPRSRAAGRGVALGLGAVLALLACAGPRVAEEPAEATPAETAPAEDTSQADLDDALRSTGVLRARLVEREPTPSAPVLSISADGRVWDGDELLFEPPGRDVQRLDARLAALAAEMPARQIDPQGFGAMQIYDGPLVLYAEAEAPMRSLQIAMERCGAARIWNLRFAGPGVPAEGLEVPLPYELSELLEGAPKVEITARVRRAGGKLDPVTGAAWDGRGRFRFDDTRELEYQLGPLRTTQLEELERQLTRVAERNPDAPVVLDLRSGTVYSDAVELLDLVLRVGYQEISFVGSYE